jgi:hypothetical protein
MEPLEERQEAMRNSQQQAEMPFYFSVASIAIRWGVSHDKASRVLENYRGKPGFMDLGTRGTRNKRRHAIIRIHPNLLREIEGSL